MKAKQLLVSGFVSYALMQMLGMLFALFMGRLHSLPFEFTWPKFFAVFLIFSIGVGFMGAILGYVFGKIQKRIPFSNIFTKSIFYHVAVNIVLSFAKGVPYIISLDFVVSFGFAILVGWFFIWFYRLLSKEPSQTSFNEVLS